MTLLMGVYLGAFAFGAILLGTSAILGGDGLDADADVDGLDFGGLDFGGLDVDADVDVDLDVEGDLDVDLDGDQSFDALGWFPILSLRFWTFFLFSFGLLGTGLSFTTTFSGGISASIAASLGFLLSYAITMTFQLIKRNSESMDTCSVGLKQEVATTTLSIRPGGTGKIRLRARGEIIDMPARSSLDDVIPIGREVIIMDVDDGVAQVLPMDRLVESSKETSARNAAAQKNKLQAIENQKQ